MEGVEGFQIHSALYNPVERRVVGVERSLIDEEKCFEGEESISVTLFWSPYILRFSFSLL